MIKAQITTTTLVSLLCAVLLFILCSSCAYNSFDSLEPKPAIELIPNTTISQLISSPNPIKDDLIIEAIIIANDETGNFYKEFYIEEQQSQDNNKAARILLDYYDSYSKLPLNTTVAIRLKGCVAMRVNGIITIGLQNDTITTTPALIPTPSIANTIINNQPTQLKIETPTVKLYNIDESLLGRRVIIENLLFEQLSGTYSGNCTLIEPRSNTQIDLNTSVYASFAADNTPRGTVTIKALIIQDNGVLKLKINSLADIKTETSRSSHRI